MTDTTTNHHRPRSTHTLALRSALQHNHNNATISITNNSTMLFVYFPLAARGELARLIAAVGGIEDFTETYYLPEGVTAAECGSTGSRPILIDGDLKMNESTAIEFYLSSIAPAFQKLTPQQRAKDAQFCSLKETSLSAIAKPLFGGKEAEGLNAAPGTYCPNAEGIRAAADKYFPILEGILPKEGFVNGLDEPTVADLVVLNICESYLPFGAAFKYGEVDLADKYPKLVAHAERTKAVESVAKYLEASSSMKVGGFGL